VAHFRYTVVSGDTLNDIADRFYGEAAAWPVICSFNKAGSVGGPGGQIQDCDLIQPGWQLRIPGYFKYTVVQGDTLSELAQTFYGAAFLFPVICEANRPPITNCDRIQVGQVLRIPTETW
jgi:nucleoid-associated protein YgaU